MEKEIIESNEKLELIEENALENTDEVTPLSDNMEYSDTPENVNEPNIEMSTCTCMGGCGSNYSHGNCTCMNNCGSNYHK